MIDLDFYLVYFESNNFSLIEFELITNETFLRFQRWKLKQKKRIDRSSISNCRENVTGRERYIHMWYIPIY